MDNEVDREHVEREKGFIRGRPRSRRDGPKEVSMPKEEEGHHCGGGCGCGHGGFWKGLVVGILLAAAIRVLIGGCMGCGMKGPCPMMKGQPPMMEKAK